MFPEFLLTSLPSGVFVRTTFWLAVLPLTRLRSVDWRGVQREATSGMRRFFFSRPFETIFISNLFLVPFFMFQIDPESRFFIQFFFTKHGLPRMVPTAYMQKFDHITTAVVKTGGRIIVVILKTKTSTRLSYISCLDLGGLRSSRSCLENILLTQDYRC